MTSNQLPNKADPKLLNAQQNQTKYTAFYPSRPFWAISKIDLECQHIQGTLHDQMAEEVYFKNTDEASLRICRDGRVLIRIAHLEQVDFLANDLSQAHDHQSNNHIRLLRPLDLEKTVKLWGRYLDFLNSFYLLLDCASQEADNFAYFHLHEITNRDAFRVGYTNGAWSGEGIATESLASVFQKARYGSLYSSAKSIKQDSMLNMRHIVSEKAIAMAVDRFFEIMTLPGSEKTMAAFAKSLAEYKVGNYETSIVLAWFVIEAAVSSLWHRHLDNLNKTNQEEFKVVNRQRKEFLTGRDFSMSITSNVMELMGLIDRPLFEKIDKSRGFRNKIVHAHKFTPSASQAHIAMNTAQEMIYLQWGIKFSANYSYSVSGF